MDIRQEELGDLVDKEMAATSAAIEEAVRRIDVSNLYRTAPKNVVTPWTVYKHTFMQSLN